MEDRERSRGVGCARDIVNSYPLSCWLLVLGAGLGFAAARSTESARSGLAFFVPFLTPLAVSAGTFAFAFIFVDYKGIQSSLVRLLISMPIITAGVVVAVEEQLRQSASSGESTETFHGP